MSCLLLDTARLQRDNECLIELPPVIAFFVTITITVVKSFAGMPLTTLLIPQLVAFFPLVNPQSILLPYSYRSDSK